MAGEYCKADVAGQKRASRNYIPGEVPSLKLGRGLIPSFRNSLDGIKPSGLSLIQIVPPVMIIKTLDSGN